MRRDFVDEFKCERRAQARGVVDYVQVRWPVSRLDNWTLGSRVFVFVFEEWLRAWAPRAQIRFSVRR